MQESNRTLNLIPIFAQEIEKEKMNLTEHYIELYKSSINKIKEGGYKIDSLIDSPHDKRFGLTLIIRPPQHIKKKIQLFLEELKKIDPHQYYYPNTDIHITVMSIISCYEGFHLNQVSGSDYMDMTQKSLKGINKFIINLQGITASESGVMIQGFPEDNTLDSLRNNLRVNFKNSALEQSIDARYSIQTAHSTILRFRNKLLKPDAFLDFIDKNKNYNFGNFEVNTVELVFNDWYQRKKNSNLLEKFRL